MKRILVVAILLILTKFGYSQDRFGFEAKLSDSLISSRNASSWESTVFTYRYEIVRHHTDSVGYRTKDSNSLWYNSSGYNNGLFVKTFYVDSIDFDRLLFRFDQIIQNSTLITYQISDSVTA